MFRFISTAIKIECKLDDGDETLYPQAKIYNSASVLQGTVNLTHVISGLYSGTWAGSATLGEYKVDCIAYTDAPHTIPSENYNEVGDTIYLVKSLNDTYNNVTLIRAMIAGRWKRDGTQMIFYGEDNVTVIATYDLKDNNGNPASEVKNPFERVKV